MIGRILLILALLAVLALPFVLREDSSAEQGRTQDRVIAITPHNEAIRQEYSNAFEAWYRERTGRSVRIDWRVIGGTSEINRYLRSEYLTRFRFHWQRRLGRDWSASVEQGFQTDRLPEGIGAEEAALRREARKVFLQLVAPEEIGIGIDLFFGGGSFDFIGHAQGGRLVDPGLTALRPEWFTDEVFPLEFKGEPFRDAQNRWFGAIISSFGIVYNRDSLRRLGFGEKITSWSDLGDPRLVGQVALSDPTKSGSVNKGFEMIVQQQMQLAYAESILAGASGAEAEAAALSLGWDRGIRLIQRIGANARYWTDSSQKPPIDVAAGDSAAGVAIDFYGRMAAEIANQRGGRERLGFVTPVGGSTFSVDPIALLRGAPNREPAIALMEFVLSPEGQRLWNQRVGTPGGPVRYNLRRQPVRRDSYAPEQLALSTDPEVLPYSPENTFVYRAEWTGKLFNELAFVIRVAALDSGPELKAAWLALIEAGFPPEATTRFSDVSRVSREQVAAEIAPIVSARARNARILQVQLSKELAAHFREQYREAERLARAGR